MALEEASCGHLVRFVSSRELGTGLATVAARLLEIKAEHYSRVMGLPEIKAHHSNTSKLQSWDVKKRN